MSVPSNLPEPRDGYAWRTMSQLDKESGKYFFTASADGVERLRVEGHVCFQSPKTDKAAVAFLKGKKSAKVGDPTTGDEVEISGAVRAA